MERILLDQVIETDYGQFDLTWDQEAGFDGNFERFFAGHVNGLVGSASRDGVYVNLGRRSGGSQVTIAVSDTRPEDDPEWEDVVEVSVEIPAGSEVRWMSWAAASTGVLEGIEPGSYRLRVSARGRDAGRDDQFANEVVDSYLLQLWPAPYEADAILRVGSDDAAYWHREVGGRR